jgi:hypothetical protein
MSSPKIDTSHMRRHPRLVAVGFLVGIAALIGTLDARSSDGARSGAPVACGMHVRHGVLPVWMRGGFSGPNPRVPYAVGEKGQIAGVLFAWPLHSPPPKGQRNKILWVPRHLSKSVAPLWIRLQRMNGTRNVGAPVRRVISTGPGPSYVDVPSAGCWRATLTWSGRRDTLDLVYTAPS